jgi:hypothetical protein
MTDRKMTAAEKRLWPAAFKARQTRRMWSDFQGLVVTLPDGTKWDRAGNVQAHDFEMQDAIAALWDVRRSLHLHKTLSADIAEHDKRRKAAKKAWAKRRAA